MVPQANTLTNSISTQTELVLINKPNNKRGKKPKEGGYQEKFDDLKGKVETAEKEVQDVEDQLVKKRKNVEELKKRKQELTKKVKEACEKQNPDSATAAPKRARQASR